MDREHGLFLLLISAAVALLLWISLRGRPDSPGYRAVCRLALSCAALLISGWLGGVGFNPVNAAAVAGLGLPGYAALTLLSAL